MFKTEQAVSAVQQMQTKAPPLPMNSTVDTIIKLQDTLKMLHWFQNNKMKLALFVELWGVDLGGHLYQRWGYANQELLPFVNNSLDPVNRNRICALMVRSWNDYKNSVASLHPYL